MAMSAGECKKYSCSSATETLDWIHAIIDFIKPFSFFWESHVVNFFKDRLWEAVDKEWVDCLREEPVENLVQIPSGVVQDHWPSSLKEFILTLRSLAFPRDQADLKKVFPDMQVSLLNNVVIQGMNPKKKHEIEALAAVVSSVAKDIEADTVIDVGAGQGYLAQVLCFEYQLPVIALDACSHHGRITDARAERIKKHYEAKSRSSFVSSGRRDLTMPKTVTCHVLSTDMLKTFINSDGVGKPRSIQQGTSIWESSVVSEKGSSECGIPSAKCLSSLLLTGLHACGDLSVTMLRTFWECEEVKAVVSIGCCYNLLSEEGAENTDSQCGFPMSKGVKSTGLSLGKSPRDLACQSADRWRDLEKNAVLHNFELHAFRAIFQMVLFKYFPEILAASPTIGRQGKTLRRRQRRKTESTIHHEEPVNCPPLSSMEGHRMEGYCRRIRCNGVDIGENEGSAMGTDVSFCSQNMTSEDRCSLFEKFSEAGLRRLNLMHMQDIDFVGLWKETEPLADLIGPYWSLRAALGPVLETLLLLDRLLFLQEQGDSLEVIMLPIFDPTLSPRNVALIAKKV